MQAATLRSEAGMAAAKDAMGIAEKFGVTPAMMLGRTRCAEVTYCSV